MNAKQSQLEAERDRFLAERSRETLAPAVVNSRFARGTRLSNAQRVLNLFTDTAPQHTDTDVATSLGLTTKEAKRVLNYLSKTKGNRLRKLEKISVAGIYRKLGVTTSRTVITPTVPVSDVLHDMLNRTAPPSPATVGELYKAKQQLKEEIGILVSKFIQTHNLFRNQVELSNDCSGVKVSIRL